MKKIIKIVPNKVPEYKLKQSNYEAIGDLPQRMLIVAPSNSGKTVLLNSLVTDVYKNCFEKIFVFSPSIFLDSAYQGLIKYNESLGNYDTDENKLYYDEYSEEGLTNILEDQKKIILKLKADKKKPPMMQILLLIDDMSDNPVFLKNSKLLNSVFCRSRHIYASCFISCQTFNSCSTMIRKNISSLIVFKLKNTKCLDNVLEEFGQMANGKKNLEMIYNEAIKEKYSFLYIDLNSGLFYKNLQQRLEIED